MWRWLAPKIKPVMIIGGYAAGAGIAVGFFRWRPTVFTIGYLVALCVIVIVREVRR